MSRALAQQVSGSQLSGQGKCCMDDQRVRDTFLNRKDLVTKYRLRFSTLCFSFSCHLVSTASYLLSFEPLPHALLNKLQLVLLVTRPSSLC